MLNDLRQIRADKNYSDKDNTNIEYNSSSFRISKPLSRRSFNEAVRLRVEEIDIALKVW